MHAENPICLFLPTIINSRDILNPCFHVPDKPRVAQDFWTDFRQIFFVKSSKLTAGTLYNVHFYYDNMETGTLRSFFNPENFCFSEAKNGTVKWDWLTHLFLMDPFSTAENLTVFWCFQAVEKRCIGNEWVKQRIEKVFLTTIKMFSTDHFFIVILCIKVSFYFLCLFFYVYEIISINT